MSTTPGTLLLTAGLTLSLTGPLQGRLLKAYRQGVARAASIRERARLAPAALVLALACALASWWLAALPVLSLLAACAGGFLPFALRRRRYEEQARERERAWPAALEQLADGLEAGLAFPAAAAFVAGSGPSALRPRFARFYQAVRDGRLEHGLDELAAAPERAAATAAALLRASFAGTPTGRAAPILRELAAVLRERFQTRERARSRALSLHREAAILALSPIAFLLLIGSTAPGYLNAYRTLGGTLVSLAAAGVIGGCYLAMRHLGRIPDPGTAAR